MDYINVKNLCDKNEITDIYLYDGDEPITNCFPIKVNWDGDEMVLHVRLSNSNNVLIIPITQITFAD